MRKPIILTLFFVCMPFIYSYAQTTAGQIQRQEELLQQEEKLRGRIQEEARVYIKKIVVKGVTLLSEEQIEQIIIPFKQRWLGKKEIKQIIDALKLAYRQAEVLEAPVDISYEISKGILEIQVAE